MGMTCSLYRAPDSTLTALRDQPEYFHDFEMLDEKPITYEVPPGLIGRLFGQKPKIVQLGHDELPFEKITEQERHDLDKAWHVLHYLMTGGAGESDQTLGFLLSGGLTIGEQIPGDDAVPRAFLAAGAREISAELSKLSVEALAARFDWPEMMRQQVYPEIAIQEKFPQQLWQDYREQFLQLQRFMQRTVELGQGFAVSHS
jgi:hypothetical protein